MLGWRRRKQVGRIERALLTLVGHYRRAATTRNSGSCQRRRHQPKSRLSGSATKGVYADDGHEAQEKQIANRGCGDRVNILVRYSEGGGVYREPTLTNHVVIALEHIGVDVDTSGEIIAVSKQNRRT
jgi:hypothetical protein